jgi:hypothetical protein
MSAGHAIDLIGQLNFKFRTAELVFLHDTVEIPRVGEESGGVDHGSRIEISSWSLGLNIRPVLLPQTLVHRRRLFPSIWTHLDRRLCASPACSLLCKLYRNHMVQLITRQARSSASPIVSPFQQMNVP